MDSGSDGVCGGFQVAVDHVSGGVFAASAAIGYREMSLYFTQGGGTAVHDFADLAIADSVTQTNVHLILVRRFTLLLQS